MTSHIELEDEESGEKEKKKNSSKGDDKTLTVLEALPARMDWRHIFHLLEEMHQCVTTALH